MLVVNGKGGRRGEEFDISQRSLPRKPFLGDIEGFLVLAAQLCVADKKTAVAAGGARGVSVTAKAAATPHPAAEETEAGEVVPNQVPALSSW